MALLSDYEKNYWQAPTDAEHGGKVLDADTMKLDEDLAVAINHKAAENLDKDGLNAQRKRALVDSDLQAEEAMPDALGPVLGKYMSEGLKSGKLTPSPISSPLTWPPPTPQTCGHASAPLSEPCGKQLRRH